MGDIRGLSRLPHFLRQDQEPLSPRVRLDAPSVRLAPALRPDIVEGDAGRIGGPGEASRGHETILLDLGGPQGNGEPRHRVPGGEPITAFQSANETVVEARDIPKPGLGETPPLPQRLELV